MKIFIIIMAMLVAMALVVVGAANASVSGLKRSATNIQSIISNLNGDTSTVQRTSIEHQQEAAQIKALLIKELENSELYLDDSGLLDMLDDVDSLLQRVHVIN